MMYVNSTHVIRKSLLLFCWFYIYLSYYLAFSFNYLHISIHPSIHTHIHIHTHTNIILSLLYYYVSTIYHLFNYYICYQLRKSLRNCIIYLFLLFPLSFFLISSVYTLSFPSSLNISPIPISLSNSLHFLVMCFKSSRLSPFFSFTPLLISAPPSYQSASHLCH